MGDLGPKGTNGMEVGGVQEFTRAGRGRWASGYYSTEETFCPMTLEDTKVKISIIPSSPKPRVLQRGSNFQAVEKSQDTWTAASRDSLATQ